MGEFIAALSRDWNSLMLYDTRVSSGRHWLRKASLMRRGPHDGAWLTLEVQPTAWCVSQLPTAYGVPVDLKDFPEPSPSWMGLAPDNSILLHRDRSTSEIYSLTLEHKW